MNMCGSKKLTRCRQCTPTGLLLFSLIVAFLFQLVCSKSSPLYPTNDWVDVNCFSTVGKSLLEGKVLYRDIYEQKGPYLYFIYAAAHLLSTTSFIGAFLIHVIAMGLFLFFNARIVQCVTRDSWYTLFSTIILALVTNTCRAFAHGGSAEELLLWMISATLFFLIQAVSNARSFTRLECFLIGAFVAFTLLVKFTVLGFYLGMVLFVLIWYLKNKNYEQLLGAIGIFLLGMLTASLPVLIYFLANGAISDLWEAYFYNNIFLYDTPEFSNQVLASLPAAIERIVRIAHGAFKGVCSNPVFALLIAAGFFFLIFKKGFSSTLRLALLLSFILLIAGIYWGKYYVYYSMPLAAFAVFGFWALHKRCTIKFRPAVSLVLLIAVVSSFFLSGNTYFMKYEKEELVTYRFAQKINTVEDATLLEYSFLDGGFYHAAQITPTCRFFCKLSITLPEQAEALQSVVDNGSVDFVVTRDELLDSPLYSCIDSAEHFFEGKIRHYYLYQLNDTAQ